MSSIKKIIKDSKVVQSIYFKYLYCPAALQMDLSNLVPVTDEFQDNHIEELTIGSPLFNEYLNFVNVNYEEKIYNKTELIELLTHHYWMEDVKTFILLSPSNHIIATISTGLLKNNKKWGGYLSSLQIKKCENKGLVCIC